MQKAELTGLVDLACSNWGSPDGDKIALYRTWWRYLSDLEYGTVLKVLDDMIISCVRWMPRVGDVRRLAIDAGTNGVQVPDVERAWFLAAQRWSAVDMGIDPPSSGDPEIDELIGQAMRLTGSPEKRAFAEGWAHVLQGLQETKYALPGDAPGILS